MAIRVLLPQPILTAGYEYLREHGYEVVDGRGFTEDDIVADIADCDAIIVRTAKITKRILDAGASPKEFQAGTCPPPPPVPKKLQALCGPTHDSRLAARRLLFFPAEADIL